MSRQESEKIIITSSASETKKIGKNIAQKLKGKEIIALQGELGAGKTVLTQGILEGLEVIPPYTSPTFVIMKHYPSQKKQKFNIYHVDAYRIISDDLLALGWEEIINQKDNIIIIEWPENVKDILPSKINLIKIKWINKFKRKIILKN